jgi:hypothetical protein
MSDSAPTAAPRLEQSARRMALTSPISRFADGLLASDLPRLAPDRRHAAVEFIGRRVAVLPSITRFGVLFIARTVDIAATVVGQDRVCRIVVKLPLPLLSEYPRLVRSLGFAYVWESWPDTSVDGGAPR